MFKPRAKQTEFSEPRRFNFIKGNNANLNNNPQFQFARKHALVHYPSGAVYSFIPKNACTTMRASLAVANGFLGEEDLENQINWVHNNTYTFSATVPELVKAPYTFTILRDPYERLASLFLDKFVDKTPVAWNFYRSTNNQVDLDKLTFEEFIGWLEKMPGLLRCDIHLRPQTDFLIYEKYDNYFRLEEFRKIESTLYKKTKINLIDTRKLTLHSKNHYEKSTDTNFDDHSCYELCKLKKSGKIPKTGNLFSPKAKKIARNIYSSDFKLMEHLGKDKYQ